MMGSHACVLAIAKQNSKAEIGIKQVFDLPKG